MQTEKVVIRLGKFIKIVIAINCKAHSTNHKLPAKDDEAYSRRLSDLPKFT